MHFSPKKRPSAISDTAPASKGPCRQPEAFNSSSSLIEGARTLDYLASFSQKRRLCDEMASFSAKDVWKRMADEYCCPFEELHRVAMPEKETQLFLEKISGGDLSFFRGKRVLELGCGASDVNVIAEASPILCRFMHECGAIVEGADIRTQGPEKFKAYALDLAKSGALDFLPTNSFDFVFCLNLIDFGSHSSLRNSPKIFRLGRDEHSRICGELRKQTERLLAKEGIFVFSYEFEVAAMKKDRNGFLDYYQL